MLSRQYDVKMSAEEYEIDARCRVRTEKVWYSLDFVALQAESGRVTAAAFARTPMGNQLWLISPRRSWRW
jgi:hypothetical protein